MNRSAVPPNDIYISIFSDELVNDPLGDISKKNAKKSGKQAPKLTGRIVNGAEENEKLTPYLKEIVDMFKKYGVNTY